MTNRQTNRYNAAVSGHKALDDRATTIFVADTPLLALKGVLHNEIIKIEADNAKQLRNKGYSAQKVQDIHTMADHAWAICNIAKEYFKALPDLIKLHKIDFHKSDFNHGTVANMKKNAQTVYDTLTNPIVTPMVAAGYNITALQVSQLQTDINTVSSDEGGPMTDIVSTQAATTALNKDFDDEGDIVDSVMNLLTPYASTNPDDYNTCMDAFEVVNFGQRNIAARIVAIDNATNTRLRSAEVAVNGKNVKTSKRGIAHFSHADLPEGNYTITITLAGYTPITLTNIGIFDSHMTRLEVKLVKI